MSLINRRVARIFRGGMHVSSEAAKGGPGACSLGKCLENMDWLGLYFACFHGGEREKKSERVVKRSNSSPLDLLKI